MPRESKWGKLPQMKLPHALQPQLWGLTLAGGSRSKTRVAESTKERTGNLVEGFLTPLSPARVLEVTGGPKIEVSWWVIALQWEPSNFQASTETDLIARWLIEGRPELLSKSATVCWSVGSNHRWPLPHHSPWPAEQPWGRNREHPGLGGDEAQLPHSSQLCPPAVLSRYQPPSLLEGWFGQMYCKHNLTCKGAASIPTNISMIAGHVFMWENSMRTRCLVFSLHVVKIQYFVTVWVVNPVTLIHF